MNESQQSKKLNQNSFLNDYIQNEMYLQNPPITTDLFIKFCEKRGVFTSKEELEFFEREKLLFPIIRIDRPVVEEELIKFKKNDGEEYQRPLIDGLQEGEIEIERYIDKRYSHYDVFNEDRNGSYYKDLLLKWLEDGNLFDPSIKDFQNWNTFIGKELRYKKEYEVEKVISFYSSFQIYWLDILKKSFLITINFAGNSIKANASPISFDNRNRDFSFPFNNINIFPEKLEISQNESSKELFNIDERKKELIRKYGEFDTFFKFLLSVQPAYFPYTKSGSGTIHISGDYKKWIKMNSNFKIDGVLEKQNLKIEDIVKWYKKFSEKSQYLLGVEKGDWIQLLKHIALDKKNKTEGSVRLGIEYLQWAIMLKQIIEDYLKREILDIDEISGCSVNDILEIEPEKINSIFHSIRAIRNKKYYGKNKNYYHDRYKRLFYLSNDFGLDYQPKIMVFVEGDTEEKIFPIIFEKYFGIKSENIGIEFINIQGISKFFGQKISIEDDNRKKEDNKKYNKIFISNFNHLVSYNLNKWQILPFFIGDDENDITDLLQKGDSISFNERQYKFPLDWQYIWGKSNKDIPFKGKDFEMANFSDYEIAEVLSGILNKDIQPNRIKKARCAGQGIKQVDSNVENHKIDINKKLIKNLFEGCKKPKYEKLSIFKRPMFEVMKNIWDLIDLNRMPIDREIELENKEYIEKILKMNESNNPI